MHQTCAKRRVTPRAETTGQAALGGEFWGAERLSRLRGETSGIASRTPESIPCPVSEGRKIKKPASRSAVSSLPLPRRTGPISYAHVCLCLWDNTLHGYYWPHVATEPLRHRQK